MDWSPLLCAPYVIDANAELIARINQGDMVNGVTIAAGGFFGPQGRELRVSLADPKQNEKIESFEYNGYKITNFEMESSALAGLSKLMGHKAMKYKQLPIGETKGTWKNNRPAEAARFCLLFSIKCSEWNKIFDLPGGKKLEDNNFPRVRDTDSETPTYKMIGKLCEIFPELAKAYK